MMAEADDNPRPAWLKPDYSYDLLYPVQYQIGEEQHLLERLQLRRMNAAEKIIAEGDLTTTERLIAILASQTQQMPVVLRKLDWVDCDRLDECLGFFTGPGRATGVTS